MTVHAYPVDGKQKSYEICEAFVKPVGGVVITDGVLRDGPAFFYGVDASNIAVWSQVKAEKREYFYSDNSYFDSTRGTYFRVTRNGLQHSGYGRSMGARFRALGIRIKPWRTTGEHVLICPQSEHFMRMLAGTNYDWTQCTMEALRSFTKRPLRVRPWNGNKARLGETLPHDLEGAHALVTWSSAAAVEAVLAGVPIVTTGPCAARPMGGDIAEVEDLPKPEREQWAGVLADNQWTLAEMRDGKVWAALNG
jgi:hypothetical protein